MKLLNNKYLLYFVALLALIINLGNLALQKYDLVILFVITSLIIYYFTKNMTIVLSLPVIIIVLYRLFSTFLNGKEGLNNDEGSSPQRASINNKNKRNTKSANNTNEKMTAGGAKRRQAPFSNKLNPSVIDNIPNKDSVKKQIGEVDKIEQAYDSLDNALGDNTIRSINGKTTELIKEQKEMLGQIKEITPTLEKALQNVAKLDLDKVMTTFTSMSKTLKPS